MNTVAIIVIMLFISAAMILAGAFIVLYFLASQTDLEPFKKHSRK